MEILTPDKYEELDAFVASHKNGGFTQLSSWRHVKNNWGFEAVVSRNDAGEIIGSMSMLIQKIPFIGTSFVYAPRGPVCDLNDAKVLADLKAGADMVAKKHNAHALKIDPDTLMADEEFIKIAKEMGFVQFAGPDGFETIQARFNYRLYLNERSEEQILADLNQKCRYNIRVAEKKGVQVRHVGKEYLDDFIRIMQVTGERDGFITRPKIYFERMLDALGENVRLYVGFYQDEVICGAITTNVGGKCCYVYGASDNNHRNVMPNYLMQWEMIKWAVQTNCFVYDFQGVSGIMDESRPIHGLYRFKKGFNGTLEELAGEFDYTYKPFKSKMVDYALSLNTFTRKLKKKLKSRG